MRKLLAADGVPMEESVYGDNASVIPFPVKSPEGAIFRNDRSALEQLDYWLQVRTHWTEHQPSVTITYRPHEVEGIIAWVKEHREMVAGLSFLPADDHTYAQAPYVEISAEEYAQRVAQFPKVDFSRLVDFEQEDYTSASREVACAGGACEAVL